MQKYVELATELKLAVEMRAFAHYVSSDYHRKKGNWWGVAAAVFGGLTAFLTTAGAAKKLDLGLPVLWKNPSTTVITVIICGVLALSVVSSVAAYLKHPR